MAKFKVFACGSNSEFQLGIGNEKDQDQLKPTFFADNLDCEVEDHIAVKPIKISCGGNHTIILLEDGRAYSSGYNIYGQCGFPCNVEKLEVFTKIPSERKWRDVSCGWEYTILVDTKEEVYVCGFGSKGEMGCGLHLTKTELRKANWNLLGAKIKTLKCSLDFSIIELEDGRLFGCGNCRKGQLGKQQPIVVNGKPKPRPAIYEPELLDFGLLQIRHFSVCRENTIILDEGGLLHAFGKNEVSQEIFKETEVLDLQTMWSSYHCLVKKNDSTLHIRLFGNNSHGQMFPQDVLPFELSSFCVGSEHGLISSKEGSVYAWGWGEHGNCGKCRIGQLNKTSPSVDEMVTFNYLNELYRDTCPLVLLACGCATSWIVVSI